MKLTHSIIKKHLGPKRAPLILSTLEGISSIDEFCDRIEKNRCLYTNYDSDAEKAPNLWAGDMLELLMEAWFQYSNTINTFHVNKQNEIPHPMVIHDYQIVDRDSGTDEEDHGVDAYASTDIPGGVTIQIKYRQKRNNLTRNNLATFIVESTNPRYQAEHGRRLVITTGEGEGGVGKGVISNITKYWGFGNIHYVNRFILSEHMDGTSFWGEFYQAVKDALVR